MQSGIDFLRERVREALSEHDDFLRSLRDEVAQANDDRVRDVCARFVSRAREHQRMLTEVDATLSAGAPRPAAVADAADVPGSAPELADAPRASDFERLVALARKADVVEADFRTFREAGRALGIVQLARVGELAERHHDEFARDAYRLVQQMFIEQARGAERSLGTGRLARPDVAR